MMETNSPSKTFLGVRFVLFGFDSINQRQVRSKLVDGGGVDVGQYGQNCTHVIVDKIVYDDPVCVAARNHGNTLVTGLWVDHSFDTGMPVDTTSIIYRPLKDLNGIPGAKNLIICLTGYQRHDREDIMTMVSLMGAQFSKPLIANKVTHLICYKFDGEKYELAKKMKKIKLVNHHWLEDCLRDWELLPEANYNKSGYELEMMEAEAKDSEEEVEDTTVKQFGNKNMNNSPHNLKVGMPSGCELPKSVGEVPKIPLSSTVPEDLSHGVNANMLSTPGKENRSHQVSSFDNVYVTEVHGCQGSGAYRDATSVELPVSHDRTPNSTKVEKDLASTSKNAKRSPESDATFGDISYSRKTPRKSMLPMFSGQLPSNVRGSVEASLGVEHAKDRISSGCVETPWKVSESHHVEESSGILLHKRMTDVFGASPKSQKMSQHEKACIMGSPSAINRTQGMEPTSSADALLESDKHFPLGNDHCLNETANLNAAQNSPSSISKINSSSLNKNSLTHDLHFFQTETSGTRQTGNAEKSPQTSSMGLREPNLASKPGIGDMEMERSAHVVSEAVDPQNHLQDIAVSLPSNRKLEMENAHRPANSDLLQGVNDKLFAKPLRKKMFAKKTLGSRPKLSNSANQKGSIYSKKTASHNDPAICSSGGKGRADDEKFTGANTLETSPPTVSLEAAKEVETETLTKLGDDTVNKTEFIDDETEPPEEKDEHEFDKALNEEKSEVVELTHKAETMMEKKSGVRHVENNSKANNTNDDAVDANEVMNGTELDNAVCGKKFEVGESNLKGDGVKGKKNKGKKQPSDKAKIKTVPAVREEMKSKKSLDGNGIENGKNNEKKGMEKKKSVLHPAGKTKSSTLSANKLENSMEVEKENQPAVDGDQNLNLGKQHVGNLVVKSNKTPKKINQRSKKINSNSMPMGEVVNKVKSEPMCFILSGHRLQRKEFQQVIRRLRGRFCRHSHQWSYQATHFIATDPIRRTEKFFAATSSGRWILKTDYLSACIQAGKFLAEEPYEWHKNGLSEDGAINLEAPRKWRLLRERTGHGAFYGMRVIVYGECIAPPLDTLKRVVKAGDGTILATSPPYTRLLKSGVDFAIVSPGMPHVDLWVQEFLKHEIPCVVADYLVEYVCKPGYSLERYVLYNTHAWAEKSFANLQSRAKEIVEDLSPPNDCGSSDISCQVCGSRDREEVMLICGDESHSVGCGIGTHIDCCDPPLADVPEEDWFCPKCSSNSTKSSNKKKKMGTSILKSK